MKTTAIIIPVKFVSRRVPDKNLRLINGKPLYSYIVDEITSRECNWDIFIYSNNINCLKSLDKNVKYLPRPKFLDGDAIRANELFGYASMVLPHKVHAIVHPTCPFLSFTTIRSCIEAVEQGGYDSSFSAERIQRYGWFEGKPLNYNPKNMVRTQELVPILMENSGIYVYTTEGYSKRGTRIGKHPFIKEVSYKEAIDIDTEDDLELAKCIAENTMINRKMVYKDSKDCKQAFPKINNLIFDFDGVLGDTIHVMEQAWKDVNRNLSRNMEIPSFENYKKYIGQPFYDILHNIGIDKKHWKQIEEIYFKGTMAESKNIQLYQGINELLTNLKTEGKRLFMYTSKPINSLRKIPTFEKIKSKFEIVLTADTLPNNLKGKPSGDGIKFIMSKGNISKEDTVYIGDTYSDSLEAENANCNFLRAEWAGHINQKYLRNEVIVFSPMHVFDIITK